MDEFILLMNTNKRGRRKLKKQRTRYEYAIFVEMAKVGSIVYIHAKVFFMRTAKVLEYIMQISNTWYQILAQQAASRYKQV